jgi:hypothetical protein
MSEKCEPLAQISAELSRTSACQPGRDFPNGDDSLNVVHEPVAAGSPTNTEDFVIESTVSGRERMDHTQRLLSQVGGLLLIIAPLVFWAGLHLAVRRGQRIPGAVLPVIRTLRWIGWATGFVLLIAYGTGLKLFHVWPLGTAILTLSIGLSFPERWVKGHGKA